MFVLVMLMALSAEQETPAAAGVDMAARLLDEGDPQGAVPPLQRYLKDLQKKPQDADFTRLGKAWLLLSTAHFRRGKEDEGQTALDELARLRPDIVIDAEHYPPLFVRLHQKALDKMRAKARASLRIAAPENALILVNGRQASAGHIADVPAGVHWVVMRTGDKQVVRRVEVRGAEVKEITFPGAGTVQDYEAQSYFSLVEPVAAPVSHKPLAPVATEPEPAVVVPKIFAVAPEQPASAPMAAIAHPGPPLYKQWWLWTIVGGVVVAAAVSTTLILTARVGNVAVTADWR